MAQDYAEGNGFGDGVDGATVTVVTPYQGDAMAVEVTVTPPPSYVIHDFGNRSARAVARSVPGGSGGYALLTLNEDECRSYDKSGSGLLDIQGGGIMVNSACNNPSNGALNGVGSGRRAGVDDPLLLRGDGDAQRVGRLHAPGRSRTARACPIRLRA